MTPSMLLQMLAKIGFTGPGAGAPTYTVLSQTQVVTSNTTPSDGNAVACPAGACNGLLVQNTSPNVVEYQRNGAGNFYPVRSFETKFIWDITDASQVAFRLRDYALVTMATSGNFRRSTISLQLVNASSAFSVGQVNGTAGTGGSYNALPTAACTAAEILNTGNDMYIRPAGGATALVRKGATYRMNGLTNLNQLSAMTFAFSSSYSVEYFQADPQLPLRAYNLADAISSDAVMYHHDTLFGDDVFTTLGDAVPKTNFNIAGTSLAIFTDAASATVTSTGAVATADTILSGDGVNMTGLTQTALHVTATGAGTVKCSTKVTTLIPVHLTNCDIHLRLNKIGVAGSITGINVELHSAGSPTAPGGNYHQMSMIQYSRGANSFGAESRSTGDAVAVGTGADMTQIIFAVARVVCSAGTMFNPQYIKAVKKASNTAKVIFTIDDFKPGAMTAALQLLSSVGYVGMCYPSPAASLNPAGSTGTTGYDALLALQTMGWQIACQDYKGEGANDFSPAGWLKENKKNLAFGIALGFDPEGLRDGSSYGGGAYFQSAFNKYLPRLMSTSRTFQNGNDLQGGSFNGYISGTTLTLTSNSPQNIVSGAILIADNATGIDDSQKVGALLTGNANTSGATYAVTISQTVGSAGSPVAFATESQGPFFSHETNPPGDPWALRALNWDLSFSTTNELNLYGKFRLYVDSAINAKGIAIFATHDGWNGALTTVQNTAMAHFLKYCKRKEALGLLENTTLVRMRRKQAVQ